MPDAELGKDGCAPAEGDQLDDEDHEDATETDGKRVGLWAKGEGEA